MSQAHVICDCLDVFCASSGQRVSDSKSHVFFSKNVHSQQRKDISDTPGFQRMDNLGRYLGVNIFHSRVKKASFFEVMDRVANRLNAWKAKISHWPVE